MAHSFSNFIDLSRLLSYSLPVRYYPINLDLRNRRAVVIGGGRVAFRKVQGLLKAGAKVVVVDPKPVSEIRRLHFKKKIRLCRRPYRRGDLQGSFAAIAATDQAQVNLAVYREAKKKRVLLNVVDQLQYCDFIFPAVLHRGEFMVTVSTGGGSPALSKKVREDLEKQFGSEYGLLTTLMASLRKKRLSISARSSQYKKFIRSPILTYLRGRNWRGVDRLLWKYFKIPVTT